MSGSVVAAALTVWGTCLTLLATAGVVLGVQYLMSAVDPRGIASWVLGGVTLLAGITYMLGV